MSHRVRQISNVFFAFVLTVMSVNLSGVLSLQSAYAWTQDPAEDTKTNHKSYICKLVGTPGQNERFQTGNNPIQRDRKDGDVIGTLFNDAQGGSFVVGFGYPSEPQSQSPQLSDCIAMVTPGVSVKTQPCTPGTTATDTVTVTVTNSDKVTGNTVVYSVTVGGTTLSTNALADDASQTLTFSGLAAGSHAVSVSAYGEVVYTGNVTVNQCTKPTTTTVTPTAPTPNEQCGTADTYTIPTTTGVVYKVNGATKAAGTYAVTPLQYAIGVHITASPANASYTLAGTTSWDFSFSIKPCPVPAVAPTKHEECGTENDGYTIPTADHVKYYVNGQLKAAGTYTTSSAVVIVAVADTGYYVEGRAIWVFDFSRTPCPQPCHPEVLDFVAPLTLNNQRHHQDSDEDCIPVEVRADEPTKVDVCGTKNDTYTIPETTGVEYYVDGVLTPAGTYATNGKTAITITTDTTDGYTFGEGYYEWTLEFTDVACEPEPCVPSMVTLPQLKMLQTTPVADNCTPGQGGAGETPKNPGTPVVTELPQTGPEARDAFAKVALILAAGLTTYGAVFFAVNRRELFKK